MKTTRTAIFSNCKDTKLTKALISHEHLKKPELYSDSCKLESQLMVDDYALYVIDFLKDKILLEALQLLSCSLISLVVYTNSADIAERYCAYTQNVFVIDETVKASKISWGSDAIRFTSPQPAPSNEVVETLSTPSNDVADSLAGAAPINEVAPAVNNVAETTPTSSNDVADSLADVAPANDVAVNNIVETLPADSLAGVKSDNDVASSINEVAVPPVPAVPLVNNEVAGPPVEESVNNAVAQPVPAAPPVETPPAEESPVEEPRVETSQIVNNEVAPPVVNNEESVEIADSLAVDEVPVNNVVEEPANEVETAPVAINKVVETPLVVNNEVESQPVADSLAVNEVEPAPVNDVVETPQVVPVEEPQAETQPEPINSEIETQPVADNKVETTPVADSLAGYEEPVNAVAETQPAPTNEVPQAETHPAPITIQPVVNNEVAPVEEPQVEIADSLAAEPTSQVSINEVAEPTSQVSANEEPQAAGYEVPTNEEPQVVPAPANEVAPVVEPQAVIQPAPANEVPPVANEVAPPTAPTDNFVTKDKSSFSILKDILPIAGRKHSNFRNIMGNKESVAVVANNRKAALPEVRGFSLLGAARNVQVAYKDDEDYMRRNFTWLTDAQWEEIYKARSTSNMSTLLSFSETANLLGFISDTQVEEAISKAYDIEILSASFVDEAPISFSRFKEDVCRQLTFFQTEADVSGNIQIIVPYNPSQDLKNIAKYYENIRYRYTLAKYIKRRLKIC